jgi:hypothetical protein
MTLDDEPLDPLPVDAPLGFDAVREAIRAALETADDIPAGHTGAAVFFLNQDKLEIAVAARLVDTGRVTWVIEGTLSHQNSGGRTGFGILNKITW